MNIHKKEDCKRCQPGFIPCYVKWTYNDGLIGRALVCNQEDMQYWVDLLAFSPNLHYKEISKEY